jgi:hypothetical protein
MILHAMMYGPQAALITEPFPARVRYAGSSLAYTLPGVIAGGFAPLIFGALSGVSLDAPALRVRHGRVAGRTRRARVGAFG